MNLEPEAWFGKVISDTLTNMADNYQRIAEQLRRLATEVPDIGRPRGLSTLTATDLAAGALGEIARNTPNPASLVRAAADYERQGFGPRPTEEDA